MHKKQHKINSRNRRHPPQIPCVGATDSSICAIMDSAVSTVNYVNYNPSRCNVCFASDLSKPVTGKSILCACQLVQYCSKEHQQADLAPHSSFCKAVQNITNRSGVDHILAVVPAHMHEPFVGVPADWSALDKTVRCTLSILAHALNRPLHRHEIHMLQHPVLCRVCLEYHRDLLSYCEGCHQVAYCSEKHRLQDHEQHAKWCRAYHIAFIIDNKPPAITNIGDTVIPCLDEADLKTFPSDCYKLASKALQRKIINPTAEDDHLLEPQDQLENVKLAEVYSYVGTILYALHCTNVIDEIGDTLNIFIVGARAEVFYFHEQTCALFFAYGPKLRTVKLFFIGPELPETVNEPCTLDYGDGRLVELIYHKELYHELPGKIVLPNPHLVGAFNCGFNEYFGTPADTWAKTLRFLLYNYHMPLVFTSYTYNEAIEDVAILVHAARKSSGRDVRFMKRALCNPLRGGVPVRNPDVSDRNQDEIFYNNGYLTVAKLGLP
ncbi:uncharacterized protein LOC118456965 isoform X2 [Anopheles albimanus]|uniref:uncharacterized protein LOC118456965 isoform X2 n=1 Tax=Anopheles albimanus TaxID=7167 RepID=UPI00163E1D73|nr:uncharacterized protein LOC118456965 isoform X2 [Anopheles albimanus]